MAVRISSYVMNAGRDDDRISGLKPDPTAVTGIVNSAALVGGMIISPGPIGTPDAGGKIFQFYDGLPLAFGTPGSVNPFPWGLLIEPNAGFPRAGASGDTAAGQGFDSLDYARGGLFSAFHRPGNILDVYDDFRNRAQVTILALAQNQSCPYIQNVTWAAGDIVYSSVAADGQIGLLSNIPTAAGSVSIGHIRAVNGTGADRILTVELQLQVV